MTHKNNYHGRKGPKKTAPKTVSPHYRVDMMHHQLAGSQSLQPSPFSRPQKTSEPARRPEKIGRKAKKGYTNMNIDIRDELYRKFVRKVKENSKSPKEVLNQLISFYNMGKINI